MDGDFLVIPKNLKTKLIILIQRLNWQIREAFPDRNKKANGFKPNGFFGQNFQKEVLREKVNIAIKFT